jgi:hypothetical protein
MHAHTHRLEGFRLAALLAGHRVLFVSRGEAGCRRRARFCFFWCFPTGGFVSLSRGERAAWRCWVVAVSSPLVLPRRSFVFGSEYGSGEQLSILPGGRRLARLRAPRATATGGARMGFLCVVVRRLLPVGFFP